MMVETAYGLETSRKHKFQIVFNSGVHCFEFLDFPKSLWKVTQSWNSQKIQCDRFYVSVFPTVTIREELGSLFLFTNIYFQCL
jgi:hypothetical protein